MKPRWALLFSLALGAIAHAEPIDALNPALRPLWIDGHELEASGDPYEALRRYQMIWAADPEFTQVLLDMGRVWVTIGVPEAALTAYAEAPYDVDVLEARAQLLVNLHRPDEAADLYATLRSLRSEDPAPYLMLEARSRTSSDPMAAAALLAEWADFPNVVWDPVALDTVNGVVAALLEGDETQRQQVVVLCDALTVRFPELATDADFQHLRERGDVQALARQLARAEAVPLTADQRQRLVRARASFGRGEPIAATRELRSLTDAAPRSPEAWEALADVLWASGDAAGAEIALYRVVELDSVRASGWARLGALLDQSYGGSRAAEARDAWQQAVRLDPTNAEWLAALANLEVLPPDAYAERIRRWQRYLELSPEGPHAAEARRIVTGSGRTPPLRSESPPGRGRPAGVGVDAWDAYWLAEAWYQRENRVEAEVHADIALAAAPEWPPALNLAARLVVDRDPELARGRWERSLAQDDTQPDVWVALAEVAERQGKNGEARQFRERAAALGSAEAELWLARDDFAADRLWEARRHATAFLASATTGDREGAAALQQRIDRLLLAQFSLGGAGIALFVGVPLGWRIRRRRGVGVDQWLTQYPAAYRDVARLTSAIRHDLLKHNTTVIPAVADALEERDPAPAHWASERWFGPQGTVARFYELAENLEVLARRDGVRLNLRWRDPIFSPIFRAFDDLRRLERPLRRSRAWTAAPKLRMIGVSLNQIGYRELGRLVRRLCVLTLNTDLLLQSVERVRREFPNTRLPQFSVDVKTPMAVQLFRTDLDEILVNALRNAIQASGDQPGARIGLTLTSESDDITGFEHAVLAICDDAPRTITTAMIRGRFIDRGLGLAVDRVNAHGGNIRVETPPGWSKAIVIRWRRAEIEDSP